MQPNNNLIAQLPQSLIVYLARHATPDRSRSDIPYHLVPGPDLTPRGLEEAAELGVFLRGVEVQYMQASPLERAWRTAVISGESAGLIPELSQDLAEWRPEELEADVLKRMQRVFVPAAEMSAERGPVVLVTHGGPIHLLLRALGLPNKTIDAHRIYDSRNLIPPAGAWRIERVDGELTMRLVFVPQGVNIPATVSSQQNRL